VAARPDMVAERPTLLAGVAHVEPVVEVLVAMSEPDGGGTRCTPVFAEPSTEKGYASFEVS